MRGTWKEVRYKFRQKMKHVILNVAKRSEESLHSPFSPAEIRSHRSFGIAKRDPSHSQGLTRRSASTSDFVNGVTGKLLL